MLSVERYEKILEELNKRGVVKVAELSKKFSVTEKTVRGDLEYLEKRGYLKRVHGGAILPEGDIDLFPIHKRQQGHSEEKMAIARAALATIQPSETILMDGGSTTLALARLLGDFPVTVITNDVRIAYSLIEKDKVHLLVLGGMRVGSSSSLISSEALEKLKSIHVDRLFLGTTAVDVKSGLSVFSSLHADWKKRCIQCADRVTLLADSTKFGKVALLQFASIEDVDEIITDGKIDQAVLEQLEHLNLRVILAT
ncbi:DeoR/GlpR family DNA-binding transcription regulator [Saccharococcus caldoxylosilyticus]|uniref:DeoR/GlpR family DNA-binding transcription regulator n=1 Tax=Saccharococcus caldoxylosilyticus TaxID=81408 RepID=UPI001FCC15A5|nr:DeoR/GlpR family DNA-binding transcription regulator [Parageobacillus caldoxylosilyticus]BDG36116.1 DeoR family transcriptional regulator [Parageobacillus caldoxylosilyticus]BDG39901.1 DeoR family transcriptional regulator [Parageobacillus caldoxylosilyticus]